MKLLSILTLLLVPVVLHSSVVSNRFVLQWEVDGTDLLLAIETDLPDTTELMISVGRIYYEIGSDSAYGQDYFSERARLSEWRNPRRIAIDDEAWETKLKTHQAEMAKLGSLTAFEIDGIDDQIKVRAVVHVNQPDAVFGGHGNPNLSGQAVSQSGKWNLVEEEVGIKWPLSGAQVPKRSRSVAFDGLRKGESYRLLTETPLMAKHPGNFDSSDGFDERMDVLGKTVYMPAGQVFRILRVVSPEEGNTTWPWYEAETMGNVAARGWINGAALMSSGVERQ